MKAGNPTSQVNHVSSADIGHPFNDTASMNTFTLEMNDTSGRWSWLRQIYGHVYTAKIAAISDLITVGDMFNDPHVTLAGYEKTVQSNPDELAASRTARAAVFLRIDPARPTQTGELTGMLPPPTGKRFIRSEQQSLLTHGIATAYAEGGVLRVRRDITTYKKNAYGVADNSYLDSETLHTSAYVLRRLKTVITSKYGRHKLANDGTRFGPGQAIVTPAVIKGELLTTYRQMERAGIVENYELFKQHLIVERDATDPSHINVLYAKSRLTNLAASYSVTVGAGGAGGVAGGQSIFGSITCGGGNGSQITGDYSPASLVVTSGASGGGASGGNIANVPGSGAGPSARRCRLLVATLSLALAGTVLALLLLPDFLEHLAAVAEVLMPRGTLR